MSEHRDLSAATRLLGDGYEPHVDALDGRLTYSIPVDAGLASFLFQFELTPADLDVLRADPYRRAALYMVLHTVLQDSPHRSDAALIDAEFRRLADLLLFGSTTEVRACIDRVDRAHKAGLDHFIAEAMRRASDRR